MTTSFLRLDLNELPEYVPTPLPATRRVIKLDANENPYGPSPRARRALADASAWHLYPSQEECRAELASYAGAAPENIVITNGADEGIELVLRATVEPGGAVIDCPPSFEMYDVCARRACARIVDVPRRADFAVDIEGVLRAAQEENVKLVMLASPNNPTGNLLPRPDLLRLLALNALVVVDEAYAEFAGTSAADLVGRFDNLVILRTFSKWAGLAGLRIGYAVAAPMVASAFNKMRSPFNVNVAGLVAARASLLDREYLMANVWRLVAERERMFAALAGTEMLEPFSSQTNFLLCRVRGMDGTALKAKLYARGIMIRSLRAPRLKEYVRITIGTPDENDALISELTEIERER